jgi:hypothetical protein
MYLIDTTLELLIDSLRLGSLLVAHVSEPTFLDHFQAIVGDARWHRNT